VEEDVVDHDDKKPDENDDNAILLNNVEKVEMMHFNFSLLLFYISLMEMFLFYSLWIYFSLI